jgi:hypothetical protein
VEQASQRSKGHTASYQTPSRVQRPQQHSQQSDRSEFAFRLHKEGLDYLATQRIASQRIARGIKRSALSPKIQSPSRTLRAETKAKGNFATVSRPGKSQAKPQQTKHLKSFEALAKRSHRVPYPESDSSDSEQGEQQEVPKTEMDAIEEASGFVPVLPYPVDTSSYRY